MLHRLKEQFDGQEMSWLAMADAVYGIAEHLTEALHRDVHITQKNLAENAIVEIKLLLDGVDLVASVELSHHAILRAPAGKVQEDE
jgi:hypothetical protein